MGHITYNLYTLHFSKILSILLNFRKNLAFYLKPSFFAKFCFPFSQNYYITFFTKFSHFLRNFHISFSHYKLTSAFLLEKQGRRLPVFNTFKTKKQWYLRHFWLNKGLQGAVVIHACPAHSEAEFKEFEMRFKSKPRLKFCWFHLNLY